MQAVITQLYSRLRFGVGVAGGLTYGPNIPSRESDLQLRKSQSLQCVLQYCPGQFTSGAIYIIDCSAYGLLKRSILHMYILVLYHGVAYYLQVQCYEASAHVAANPHNPAF